MLPALVNAAFTASYERDFSRVLDLVLAASSSTDKQAALSSALEALSSSAIAQTTSYDPSFVPPDLPPPVDSVEPTSVTSFPLRLSHTSSYLGEPVHGRDRRTALVGDAAHTIHPLAGQGLNMGLGDVSELVRVLEETFEDGGDVGGFAGNIPCQFLKLLTLNLHPLSRFLHPPAAATHRLLHRLETLPSIALCSKSRPPVLCRPPQHSLPFSFSRSRLGSKHRARNNQRARLCQETLYGWRRWAQAFSSQSESEMECQR